jgi:hypothetical protein
MGIWCPFGLITYTLLLTFTHEWKKSHLRSRAYVSEESHLLFFPLLFAKL